MELPTRAGRGIFPIFIKSTTTVCIINQNILMTNRIARYFIAGILTVTTLLQVQAQTNKNAVVGYVFEDLNKNGVRDNNEPGIKGVTVSDQVNIAVTNDQGMYELINPGGYGILFISTPDGYAITNTFWQPTSTTGLVSFALTRIKTPAAFTFIQASDTHISEKAVDRMDKFRAIIDSVKPSLVIITGDLVKDALRVPEKEATSLYQLFTTESNKIKVPLRLIPGNHEIFGIERQLSLVSPQNPLYGRKMYRHYFGPDYYSFNYGGLHFIGLNSLEFEDLWYYGSIDSVQLEWLKKDLATVPASMPVVTFQHVPFFSGGLSLQPYQEDGPARVIEKEKGVVKYRHIVSNAEEVLAVLKDHNYPLALAGHYHSRQRFYVEGLATRFEQTGAVIGPSEESGIKMPSGIMVYNVKEGKIDEGHFVPLDKK